MWGWDHRTYCWVTGAYQVRCEPRIEVAVFGTDTDFKVTYISPIRNDILDSVSFILLVVSPLQ